VTRSASSAREIDHRLASATILLIGTGLFGTAVADLLSRTGVGAINFGAWDDDNTLNSADDMPRVTSSLLTTDTDEAISAIEDLAEGVDLLITATCDAPRALFEEINELALATRTPWLIGNTAGSAIELGPLVLPYETACYTCLLLRQRSADPLAVEHEIYEKTKQISRQAGHRNITGESVWASTQAASFLVGEAIRVLTGIAPPTMTDAAIRMLPISGTLETNQVLRVPRCPACYRGDVPATAIDTIDLQPAQSGSARQ
jgi:bacteriocin biosynthesis cyclodehydratase domain-containing protein